MVVRFSVASKLAAGLVVLAVGLALVLAGRSNASDKSASAASSSAGQAAAKKIVARYSQVMPLKLKPLSKRPPRGKKLVMVDCTLPICVFDIAKPAVLKLGWKYDSIPFDVTKGPQAFGAAVTQALQQKPDYLMMVGVFPPETIAPQLAEAKKEGIVVTYIAGVRPDKSLIAGCTNCAPYLAKVGSLQADMAVADQGTKSEVVSVSDPSIAGSVPVFQGQAGELKRLGAPALKKVDISSYKPPADNAATVVSFLQRNPNVRAVITGFPDPLVSLPEALAQAGLANKVKFYNSQPHAVDFRNLRAGRLGGIVALDEAWHRAVDFMARKSVGDPVVPYPSNWWQLLTKANLRKVGEIQNPKGYEQTYYKAWHVG